MGGAGGRLRRAFAPLFTATVFLPWSVPGPLSLPGRRRVRIFFFSLLTVLRLHGRGGGEIPKPDLKPSKISLCRRGLAAARDLEKGERVLRVPKAALLTSESVLADERLAAGVKRRPQLSAAQVRPPFFSLPRQHHSLPSFPQK